MYLYSIFLVVLLMISSSLSHLYSNSIPGSNLQLHGSAMMSPGWSFTDPLHEARWSHSATMLPDGRVLVAGGETMTAELFDPATGTWSMTGSMHTTRSGHAATLLPDGTVLVAGGFANVALASAEVYNPATGTWRKVGTMSTARGAPAAALLADGKVLITGGYDHPFAYFASAEIYDPATETWHTIRPMTQARANHTATLLPDGTVLVAGGYIADRFTRYTPYTTEVYNPVTDVWQRAGNLAAGRGYHTATLLPNGTVLVAGGTTMTQGQGQVQAATEVYDPATRQWQMRATLQEGRMFHRAIMLPGGLVAVAGGFADTPLASVEIYDFTHNAWYRLPDLTVARHDHTLTFVAPDTMLVAGGRFTTDTMASAEIYHVSDIPSLGPQSYLPLMMKPE